MLDRASVTVGRRKPYCLLSLWSLKMSEKDTIAVVGGSKMNMVGVKKKAVTVDLGIMPLLGCLDAQNDSTQARTGDLLCVRQMR